MIGVRDIRAVARRALKFGVFGIGMVITSPLILLVWLEKRLAAGEGAFAFSSQLLALFPGLVGVYLRAAYYYSTLDHCSWETHVGFGSLFTHRGATLGRNVSMGAYCIIGHADIGQNVMIASRVSVPSGKRQHVDDEGRMTPQPRYERVTIGSGCWVGEGATVLADIGELSVVSAGAVVARRIPPCSLVAGNPASVIRELNRDGDGVRIR